MEELYSRLLFNEMLFKLIFGVLGIGGMLAFWFAGDVIKIKDKGIVVREIKLKKWQKVLFKRLIPLICIPIFVMAMANPNLDFIKKDYLYGEGEMTGYQRVKSGEHIYIDGEYYDLPAIYKKHFSRENIGMKYKFVYAKRTKLILYIEPVDDNE